jgi:hypothetical protein
VEIMTENRSDLPIYEVMIMQRKARDDRHSALSRPMMVEMRGVLPYGNEWSEVVKNVAYADREIRVTFKDAAGRRWGRRSDGALRQLTLWNDRWLGRD